MVDAQYSRNIITTLAGLPDFLRKSMLEKRLAEFYTLGSDEQREIIDGALATAPDIPFDDLARLLKTWLKAVCTLSDEERRHLFASYAAEACSNPSRFVSLNLDGMLGVLLSLDEHERATIAAAASQAIRATGKPCQKILMSIIPNNAKPHIGI